MKILIAGDWHSELHERALFDALTGAGHEVLAFEWHVYFHGQAVLDRWRVLPRAQNKYMWGPRVNLLNREFVEAAMKSQPDAIVVYRGSHIYPETLRSIKRFLKRTVLIGYNNDNPFSLFYPKWMWRHFLACVPIYDLVLSYRPANIADYRAAGARRVELWRSWFCLAIHRPEVLTEEELRRFKCDVVFVGHFENDGRLEAIAQLAAAKISVRIFGPYKGLGASGWFGNIDRYPALRHSVPTEYLSGKDYVKALCGARIALCFLSKLNRDSYTRRCFEIPATGTALFSEYSDDLNMLFSEGKDAEFFRSQSELVAKTQEYLLDTNRLAALGVAGRQRVLDDGHDIGSRAIQLVKWVEELK